MATTIRRGKPSDADFLAWVMLSASRGHLPRGLWDVIIGGDEGTRLDYLKRLAVAEPQSLYHLENFLVADVDGAPAAALCGFETRDAWSVVGQAMANVQRDLGWTDADAQASYARVAPIWSTCMPADIGADFAIENVATLPEYRRRGLVRALIERLLQTAGQRGCRLVQIATLIGNDPARAAYEKSGFRFDSEKRCDAMRQILGAAGFMRFLRRL